MSGAPLPESPPQPASAPLERLLLCDAGGRRFALPLGAIREVVPARSLTRLPGAPPEVAGLANLRGRIVTVVDLAARLGLSPEAGTPGHRLVVVEHRGLTVAVSVRDVIRIVQPATDELRPAAGEVEWEFVRATGEFEHRPFLVLDPDALLHPILAGRA